MRRIAVVAVAATLTAAGVVVAVIARDDGPPSGEPGIFGPGTEIGDGFTVVERSALLGTRFPLDMEFDPRKPSVWIAVLFVDRDPLDVLTAYGAQAEGVGLPIFTANEAPCYRDSPGLVQCRLRGETGPWNAPAGRAVDLALRYSNANSDAPFASHLVIRHEVWGDTSLMPSTPPSATPKLSTNVRFGPRTPSPELATTGESIAPHLQPSWDRQLIEVESGSELLAPPIPLSCDAQPGFEAVLRITGAPATVVGRYVNQFRRAFGRGLEQPRRHLEQDGLDVTQLRFADSGFGNADAVAVTVPSGESYLWIERCGD